MSRSTRRVRERWHDDRRESAPGASPSLPSALRTPEGLASLQRLTGNRATREFIAGGTRTVQRHALTLAEAESLDVEEAVVQRAGASPPPAVVPEITEVAALAQNRERVGQALGHLRRKGGLTRTVGKVYTGSGAPPIEIYVPLSDESITALKAGTARPAADPVKLAHPEVALYGRYGAGGHKYSQLVRAPGGGNIEVKSDTKYDTTYERRSGGGFTGLGKPIMVNAANGGGATGLAAVLVHEASHYLYAKNGKVPRGAEGEDAQVTAARTTFDGYKNEIVAYKVQYAGFGLAGMPKAIRGFYRQQRSRLGASRINGAIKAFMLWSNPKENIYYERYAVPYRQNKHFKKLVDAYQPPSRRAMRRKTVGSY